LLVRGTPIVHASAISTAPPFLFMSETSRLKRELTRKRKRQPPPGPEDFLSSGCTVLNLAASGSRRGAFAAGHYYWLVGDSTSGKTFLGMTCFAEAMRNPRFRNYRLIYDQPEKGALMDLRRYFGAAVAERLESPRGDGLPSQNIEDFFDNFDDAVRDGRPFIWLTDSTDALGSESEDDKFEEQKAARRKGRDPKGSMTDGKAKKYSSGLRRILRGLQKTGSILILISQTRDNINPFTAKFNPKVHSGGRALKFYATLEIWSSVKMKIRRPVKGRDRTVGVMVKLVMKKNRFTGKDRMVELPIYHSHGFDDTGANVAYLLAERHWKGNEKKLAAPEFRFSGSAEHLAQHIEKRGLEKELQRLVGRVWAEIEAGCVVKRKPRYE
jgi:recA bacterial DNA recombination protein